MPLQNWVRRADANNTRAAALIGAGLNWTGLATPTAGASRVDITITAAQAGVLLLQESADGAAWVTTETWAVPIGTVAAAFPFPLNNFFWRAQFTDGGVGGNFQFDAVLDPRAVDHEAPVAITNASAGGAGTTDFARPIGARAFYIDGLTTPLMNNFEFHVTVRQMTAAGVGIGEANQYGKGMYRRRLMSNCGAIRIICDNAITAEIMWMA